MLNKIIIIIAIAVVITSIITIPSLTEQFVDAKSHKKIHFTQTISSSQDPGKGHESHQIAIILSPNEGTLYDASLTYTASEPVQVVVLHEILNEQAKEFAEKELILRGFDFEKIDKYKKKWELETLFEEQRLENHRPLS